MRRIPAFAILGMALACGSVMAGPQPPAHAMLWTAADLKSLDGSLVSRMGRTGAAYYQVIKSRTYGVLVLHREATGEPELHVKLNDFFVILSGEGEIEVGGRVSGERAVTPDERRGRNLVGGTFYKLAKGDVMFVPANHWLQLFVAKGRVLRTIIIKTQ